VRQEGLVLLQQELVLRRVNSLKVAEMLILPAIALEPVLFDELVSFLLGLPGLLASEGAFEQFALLEAEGVVFDLVGDVDEGEGVADEALLDERVERGVGGEAGRVVDLQDHGLERAVEDHVEPQDLEAHVVAEVVRLAGAVVVGEGGLHRDERLGDEPADLAPDLLAAVALLVEAAQDGGEGALVAAVHVLLGLVELELGVRFVDRVVGQVHEQIAQVLLLGRAVGCVEAELPSVANLASPSR